MSDIINTIHETMWLFLSSVALISLAVGSFLNVVIHRLPIMMDRGSQQFCHEFLKLKGPLPSELSERFDLILPLSHCPKCKCKVKPWHNIPLISYLLLKGQCASCKTQISARYFFVELLTSLSSVFLAWHFGFTWMTLAALFFNAILITLLFIDIDHQLLPDALTLLLLWLGLFVSLFHLYISSQMAILGAIAGYLVFWLIAHGFKWLAKKDGMGYGDFKLLAALGAWLGWQSLPLVIFLSALTGLIGTLAWSLIARKSMRGVPVAFGPYLVLGGWIGLVWGDRLTHWYLSNTGVII